VPSSCWKPHAEPEILKMYETLFVIMMIISTSANQLLLC